MAEVINIDFESGFIDSHGHTVTPTGATLVSVGQLSGEQSATVAVGGSVAVSGVSIGNANFTFQAIFSIAAGSGWAYRFVGCGTSGLEVSIYEELGDVFVDVGLNDDFSIGSETLVGFTYVDTHHIEVARSGTTVYLFFNGDLLTSVDFGAQNLTATDFTFANDFAGLIDNVKLDVGAALHTAGFTPDFGPPPGSFFVADGGDSASVFRARVLIDGVDQTTRIIGQITVEMEEGAASIAEITLKPDAATPVYLPSWTGKSVVISIGDYSTGTLTKETVRFTGKVDLPTVNLEQKTLSLRCTDDLQGVVSALTAAQVETLIGGYYSSAVFDLGSIWVLAQDRLSTVRASLDISPSGVLRLTDWTAKPAADVNFNENDIAAGSLAIDLADRASMVNRVDITFGYRFPRMKSEGYHCVFDALDPDGFEQYIIDGMYFMSKVQVKEAIESAGGAIVSIAYDDLPTTSVTLHGSGGAIVGVWVPNPYIGPSLCTGFDAVVSFDFSQETDETHRITVSTPESIAEIGTIAESMSGAMVSEYADTVSVETTATLYQNKLTAIPPMDVAPVVSGRTNSTDVTSSTSTNRAAANNAMETLIAIAKARIAAAHRANTVSFVVPLNSRLDTSKTVQITTASVVAKGKVRRIVETIDTDAGQAISAVDLAISGISGVGITHLEDPTEAPAGTAAGLSSVLGAPVVVFNNGPLEDHSLQITFPGVDDNERLRVEPVIVTTVNAAIHEDVFTVTI